MRKVRVVRVSALVFGVYTCARGKSIARWPFHGRAHVCSSSSSFAFFSSQKKQSLSRTYQVLCREFDRICGFRAQALDEDAFEDILEIMLLNVLVHGSWKSVVVEDAARELVKKRTLLSSSSGINI